MNRAERIFLAASSVAFFTPVAVTSLTWHLTVPSVLSVAACAFFVGLSVSSSATRDGAAPTTAVTA